MVQQVTSIVDDAAVEDLKTRVRGDLIRPGDAQYDEARKVYNGMIDKHPALIVRCVDVADVISAVNFAREKGLTLAVRGGGHNGPGLGTVDDGVVVDLSRMKGVYVDAANRTVRVEGGAVWGDVDHATHPFGLATPSGFVSSTGVGGLTLGGGIGYLSRAYGLTLDNLLGVDMVLADGSVVTANDEGASRSLLGGARRRRQLWRRDLVPVPAASDQHGLWRADVLPAGPDHQDPALVARLHPERARRHQWLVRRRHRAARAAIPRAVSHAEDVRDRLVLYRPARSGRGALRVDPLV